MTTLPNTTEVAPSPSYFSKNDPTVILASISCTVFFVLILVLLSILYEMDPFCCKDPPSQYYSSRQTLVGSRHCEQDSEMVFNSLVNQPGQLFLIGQPNSYHLPPLEAHMPYLPSYGSVCKKDQQQPIHLMSADRSGLIRPILPESPPTYEESMCQATEVSHDDFSVTPTASSPSIDLYPAEPQPTPHGGKNPV